MPENGIVFAQNVFNTMEYPGAPGNNHLRDRGYAFAVKDLVFNESVYGQLGYNYTSGNVYGGSSEQAIIKWVYTSSITQSFYNANPQISQDEVLFVLNQNYVPTGSTAPSVVEYKFYIPVARVNRDSGWTTRPTATFEPLSGSLYNISFEYYWLTGETRSLEVATFRDIPPEDGDVLDPGENVLQATRNLASIPSGTISFTTASGAEAPWYIRIMIETRSLAVGDLLVLRNLKVSYPVNPLTIEPFAQVQDLHLQTSTGMTNARYNGSKMTSPDFNIDSPDTIDGGPVVTVTTVNPKTPTKGDTVAKTKITPSDIKQAGNISGKGNFKIG